MRFIKLFLVYVLFIIVSQSLAGESDSGTDSAVQLGVEEVRVNVKGLACPFCAYNIEKRVKKLDGVDRKAPFNVSLERGVASFTWKPSIPFGPSVVNEQVKKAGFTPGTIDVTVSGHLSFKRSETHGEQGQIALHLPMTHQNVAISASKRADRVESYALLLRKAKHLQGNSMFAVRIRATVLEEKRSWKLKLKRWEPLFYGARVVIDVETFACERCATGVMRSLMELEGVIHVEADHEKNHAVVWTSEAKPRIELLKKTVVGAGFKVTQVEVLPKATGSPGR